MMDSSRSRNLENSKYRLFLAFIVGIVELLIVLSGSLVLIVNDASCERPIRLWIYVLVGVLGAHILLMTITEVAAGKIAEFSGGSFYLAVNAILFCFMFLWMLAGTIWVFDRTYSCSDEFSEGYTFTLIVVLAYYSVLGLIILFAICLLALMSFGRLETLKLIKE